jgi:putative transposase
MAGHRLPAISTVHAVLDRHGLVTHRRRRRRPRLTGTPLAAVSHPKGSGAPITRAISAPQSALLLSAHHHRLRDRYLLACEALSTTQERYAFSVFERAFQDFGLPRPFGPTTACRSRRRMRSTA